MLPERGRKFRWMVIVYGIVIFLWLSPEDNHVWPVVLLGVGASALMVTYYTLGAVGGKPLLARYAPLLFAVMGTVTGLGAGVITVLLMLFKNISHSHVFLDYPVGLMAAVLNLAPVWALAGGLVGAGFGLAWWAFHPED